MGAGSARPPIVPAAVATGQYWGQAYLVAIGWLAWARPLPTAGSLGRGCLPLGAAWSANVFVTYRTPDHRVGRSGARIVGSGVRGVDLASRRLPCSPPTILATVVLELNMGKGGEEMTKDVESAAEGGHVGRHREPPPPLA
jgi:hypothetical protein